MYFSGKTLASLRKEWYTEGNNTRSLFSNSFQTVFKPPERRAYLPLFSTIYDPNKYPTNHVPDHKWECLHTNRARQH